MNEKLIELLRKWQEEGKEALSAAIEPETINTEQRTVDVVFFTGMEVLRYDWRREELYMLQFDPTGCDLSHLNNGAPLLDNHSSWSVRDQLGCVEKGWEAANRWLATVRFSKRKSVDDVWLDVQDKIVTKLSMGVEFLELKDLGRREKDDMLMKRAVKWRPFELSFTSVPADFGTTTLAALARTTKAAPAPQSPAFFKGARSRQAELLRIAQ